MVACHIFYLQNLIIIKNSYILSDIIRIIEKLKEIEGYI